MKKFLFVQKSDRPRTLLWPVVAALILLGAVAAPLVSAQQRMSRKYPTGKNVRLQLKNISGEIIVESWDRDEIKVSATMESPAARFSPRPTADGLIIDVIGDNRGRSDVGNKPSKSRYPFPLLSMWKQCAETFTSLIFRVGCAPKYLRKVTSSFRDQCLAGRRLKHHRRYFL